MTENNEKQSKKTNNICLYANWTVGNSLYAKQTVFSCSKKESKSNDILTHFEEFSNVNKAIEALTPLNRAFRIKIKMYKKISLDPDRLLLNQIVWRNRATQHQTLKITFLKEERIGRLYKKKCQTGEIVDTFFFGRCIGNFSFKK